MSEDWKRDFKDPFLNPDAPRSHLLDDVDPAWGLPRSHHDHPLNVEYRKLVEANKPKEEAMPPAPKLLKRAEYLVNALKDRGVPADIVEDARIENVIINVWAPEAAITDDDPNLNRYPQTSVVLADGGKFHDYSWGHNWEHSVPIDTDPAEVAAAVFGTLPENVREAAQRD